LQFATKNQLQSEKKAKKKVLQSRTKFIFKVKNKAQKPKN